MLTRVGSDAKLKFELPLLGWCPFCEWEGWLHIADCRPDDGL
jgi:hypothetical protein